MAENAVLWKLEDRTGARAMIDMLGLSLASAIPLSGGTLKLLFFVTNGCWILEETPSARAAAAHTMEFVSFDRIQRLTVDLTDASRHSSQAVDRLRGMNIAIGYESCVTGGTTVDASADAMLDAVHHDDDAVRLLDVCLQLVKSCSTSGVSVLVIASSD